MGRNCGLYIKPPSETLYLSLVDRVSWPADPLVSLAVSFLLDMWGYYSKDVVGILQSENNCRSTFLKILSDTLFERCCRIHKSKDVVGYMD